MFTRPARLRSIAIYHLHMGGPDADAVEWRALMSPRFEGRLKGMGARFVDSALDADVMVVTGLLLTASMDDVLAEIAGLPTPSVLVAAGDNAINGGQWARLEMPGLDAHHLQHYAEVQITVPGDPPTPQALIAALAAAAELMARPDEKLSSWSEDED
jgi:Ni,Fe-hydrogenase III small subunit